METESEGIGRWIYINIDVVIEKLNVMHAPTRRARGLHTVIVCAIALAEHMNALAC